MRVYLDNCCFNRPFDDQRQARVRAEAEAKLRIQQQIRDGQLELAWSYMLDYENSANPSDDRRVVIAAWRERAVVDVEETADLLAEASRGVRLGLKPQDAVHVACAVIANCDWLLTTDDGLLRKGVAVTGTRVANPTAFIERGSG